jgi:hypothetical protein
MIPREGHVVKCYTKAHGLTIGKLYTVLMLFVSEAYDFDNIYIQVNLDNNERGFYPYSYFSRKEKINRLLKSLD